MQEQEVQLKEHLYVIAHDEIDRLQKDSSYEDDNFQEHLYDNLEED